MYSYAFVIWGTHSILQCHLFTNLSTSRSFRPSSNFQSRSFSDWKSDSERWSLVMLKLVVLSIKEMRTFQNTNTFDTFKNRISINNILVNWLFWDIMLRVGPEAEFVWRFWNRGAIKALEKPTCWTETSFLIKFLSTSYTKRTNYKCKPMNNNLFLSESRTCVNSLNSDASFTTGTGAVLGDFFESSAVEITAWYLSFSHGGNMSKSRSFPNGILFSLLPYC